MISNADSMLLIYSRQYIRVKVYYGSGGEAWHGIHAWRRRAARLWMSIYASFEYRDLANPEIKRTIAWAIMPTDQDITGTAPS
jgi:hypothetical protein